MKRLTFNAAMEQFYRESPRTAPAMDADDEHGIVEDMLAPDGPMPWDELPEDMG